MESWRHNLVFDPIPPLVTTRNEAIRYFSRRDLLGEKMPAVASLWESDQVRKLLRKQNESGYWRYPSVRRVSWRSVEDYDQIETYRVAAQLVEKFGMTCDHTAIRQAADYFFRIKRTTAILGEYMARNIPQTILRQSWSC